jgi:aminoglycoside phosphotransferase (APT) family kinase protein
MLAPMDMHAGQLDVDAGTVRELVDAQFPDWRDLPVRAVRSSGTTNALFRVGEAFVARFPLMPGDAIRQALREALRCDDLEWARGAAWAFQQAMGTVWYYADSNPSMSLMGRRTLERILADGPRETRFMSSPCT